MFNDPPNRLLNYKLNEKIIRTAHSVIFVATDNDLNKKVILKFIPILEDNKEQAKNECDMQHLMVHPYTMSARYFHFSYQTKYINEYHVLEMPPGKCSLESIHEFIKEDQTMYKIMYQCLLAIDFLHENRILHGDIKPQNFVLMDENIQEPEIRVIDYGHSHRFEDADKDKCFLDTISGTLAFDSPELLSGSPHSFPSDIWSLGATFYFLITGHNIMRPTEKFVMLNEARHLFLRYDDKKFGPNFPSEGRRLIFQMLNFEPNKRPTTKDCLNSEFFTRYLEHEWILHQNNLINPINPDYVENIQTTPNIIKDEDKNLYLMKQY